jgi:hypothetical protein
MRLGSGSSSMFAFAERRVAWGEARLALGTEVGRGACVPSNAGDMTVSVLSTADPLLFALSRKMSDEDGSS